jgi:hypothetical protein
VRAPSKTPFLALHAVDRCRLHAVSCSSNCESAADPACRVADYFAQLNNKMGGDLKKIQVVGEYMVEIWKAVGMDMERVQFVSASEEINS